MKISTETLGTLGGFINVSMYASQWYTMIVTRKTKDLSMTSIVLGFVASLCWVYYGWALGLWSLMTVNGIVCLISLGQIITKIKCDNEPPEPQSSSLPATGTTPTQPILPTAPKLVTLT